jgi:hypothetical protein
MIVYSCYFLKHTYIHIRKTLNVTVSKVFDKIRHSTKVLKRHQNRDDPNIMAWDHYSGIKVCIHASQWELAHTYRAIRSDG